MADEDAETEGPAVELGDHQPVEGAPIARVAARLHYGIPRSDVERREGETVVRTPEGPQTVSALLETVDATYFARREDLEGALREAAGRGPIPTGES